MELFLDRLSECQLSESSIRKEREALLKRQEEELINLDKRLVNIATQRNSILEEFKNFLEATPSESNASPSPTKQRPQSFHFTPNSCQNHYEIQNDSNYLQVERPSSSGGSTPISQYLSPMASPLPEIKDPIPPTPPTLSPPVVENRRIIRSPIRRQNAETQLPKLPDAETSPRLATDLKLSITKPTRKLVSPKVLDSPATEKIEKLLNQVKNNAHPLEEAAVNDCIDLLSSKCDAPTLVLTEIETPKIGLQGSKSAQEFRGEAPVRRNAMKKRVETPEERRKRIEAVLFGPSPEEKKKQEMSHSSTAINELGRTQSAILDGAHPYGGRRSSGNVNMKQQSTPQQTLKRNQSLSPLRFGANGRSLDSIEDELTDPSMEEILLRPNMDKRSQMRRAQSDAALRADSDSFSAATSFDDDFEFENDAAQVLNASMNADDQDHLLAPSKVAKSQNMFHQTLFGSSNNKRLLTKEEIARSRRFANQNKLAAKRARSFEQATLPSAMDDRDDERDRSPSRVPGTLRAEQLVQMRGSSASPDQRQIDRELNTVANLKRFQSYQNFWEHKTKETLDKQKRLSTLSASSDSRSSSRSHNTAVEEKTEKKMTATSPLVKTQTVSPKPKKKTTKSSNSSKTTASSPSKGTSLSESKSHGSIMKAFSETPATSSNVPREKESKSLLDRFNIFASSNSKKKEETSVRKSNQNGTGNKTAFIDKTNAYNNNNGYKHEDYYGKNNMNHNGNNGYAGYGYNEHHSNSNSNSNNSTLTNYSHNSNAPLKPEIESDKLLQRVRNIHEDIRQRKMQHKNSHNSSHHQLGPLMEDRPSIQAAKSLDLQYYALKAKQVPIKLIEPNGPEPGLAKNRFRLIRSGSRDNSTEQSSDDNFDALSQASFASTAISDCSMQHMRPHSRTAPFRETSLHKPMKSTYF